MPEIIGILEENMEFSLSKEIGEAAGLLEQIIDEVYNPLEQEILSAAHVEASLIDDCVLNGKDKILDASLWAVEVPESNSKGLGFLGRVVLEEKAGASIFPQIDLGGKGDLSLWVKTSRKECLGTYFAPVLEGRKDYEVVYLEPNLNEDISNIRIEAIRDGEKIRLKGKRSFVTSKKQFDFLVVLATQKNETKSIPGFVVVDTKGAQDIAVCEDELPLGFNKYNIEFDNFAVLGENWLGDEPQSSAIIKSWECLRNIIYSARSIGAAWRCIEIADEYYQKNVRLSRHEAIQAMMADAVTEIHAARILAYSRAQEIDDSKYDFAMSYVTKVFSTEAATRAIENMRQILADKGFSQTMPMETLYRIVRVYRIIDRPSEIHRQGIAFDLMGRDVF